MKQGSYDPAARKSSHNNASSIGSNNVFKRLRSGGTI